MSSVNGNSPAEREHLAMLIDLVGRRLRRDLQALAADAAPQYPDLRGAHFRLLQIIPAGGARITDLAELAAMTKQALGQLVDHLERTGYVESVRMPDDRRVRLVRRTKAGDEAVASALDLIARLEASWRAELGERRYATMRNGLRELVGDQVKLFGQADV
jgi:DNA-binding MarR family transcriptional regulator